MKSPPTPQKWIWFLAKVVALVAWFLAYVSWVPSSIVETRDKDITLGALLLVAVGLSLIGNGIDVFVVGGARSSLDKAMLYFQGALDAVLVIQAIPLIRGRI